ncbi:VirD4-like conjugal transfer protein, CD1115 family [Butyrivibrio sp. TB]|uniref:VirD4-like conjugal transfer protein, CD1115 family n=1 Tax=Butyrivibrio sp. TB TaxID=1520809 RepID=UPI0008D679ED|nr:type IV secretion system protein VirD4 [Butyrivibrio sp. TB]
MLEELNTTRNKIYLGVLMVIWYLADKGSWLYHQMNPNVDSLTRFLGVFSYYSRAFKNPFPSFSLDDIKTGFIAAFIAVLIYLAKNSDKKMYRKGEEYGSARWGTKKDIQPYFDHENEDNNILLTQTEKLRLNGRFPLPKYERNKNVLIVGGSGSGKTRFYIKPQLMQMHSSYVVTDPKGTIILECGKMLQRGPVKYAPVETGQYVTKKNGKPKLDKFGNKIPIYKKDAKGKVVLAPVMKDGKYVHEPYDIKVFNTINFDKSMHYNPFAYLRKEKDIMTLVTTLVENTKGEGDKSGEDFWVKAEKLLYMAYIGYLFYEAPPEEQNFETLLELINASECREDDENYKNAVDLLFEDLEKQNPKHFAVRMYKKYKLAAGKTAKSILISCGARLGAFDIEEIREITRYDELALDTLGDHKSALFVIISDTDDTFNFLVSIMYTQLFNTLCQKADDVYGGRLPVHVRCLCDEFANIGLIPKFEKLIATIRSREISASIVLQAKSQLKSLYKDNSGTIIGNCDSRIFLGGSEEETLKSLSEELGKQTIDMRTTSLTKGSQQSSGVNDQKVGRELKTRDELSVLDGGQCILQVRGVRPFLSQKYDITKHKRYKLLKDADPRNDFDIKKFLIKKRKEHSLDVEKILRKNPDIKVKTYASYEVSPTGKPKKHLTKKVA